MNEKKPVAAAVAKSGGVTYFYDKETALNYLASRPKQYTMDRRFVMVNDLEKGIRLFSEEHKLTSCKHGDWSELAPLDWQK